MLNAHYILYNTIRLREYKNVFHTYMYNLYIYKYIYYHHHYISIIMVRKL